MDIDITVPSVTVTANDEGTVREVCTPAGLNSGGSTIVKLTKSRASTG